MTPELAMGEVPGTIYALAGKGWMTAEIFNKWFKCHFLRYASAVRPIILLMDGHSSHYCPETIQLAAAEGVILFTLPPNTTHLSQPLDKGVFGPFKIYWRQVCHDFRVSHPGRVVMACRILQLTKLSIRVVNVSVQEDGTDCGLHAIAMAMDLCCDVDPFLLDYENVNRRMRKHLSCCFEERMLSQFPSQPIEREDRLLGTVHIDLYCVCRQPEHGQMACCDECDTWYHPGCIYIPEDVLGDENDLIPWSCPSCECY